MDKIEETSLHVNDTIPVELSYSEQLNQPLPDAKDMAEAGQDLIRQSITNAERLAQEALTSIAIDAPDAESEDEVEKLEDQIEEMAKAHEETKAQLAASQKRVADLEKKIAQLRKAAEAKKESGGLGSLFSGFGDSLTTMSVLSASTQASLVTADPLSMGKIGRIIKNMQKSDYKFKDSEVDLVVKAMYVTQADKDFEKVFELFDSRLSSTGEAQGYLSGEVFKELLPLLGEDVDPDKIDQIFEEVDEDGSGSIEFDEFKTLMLSIPNQGK